MESGLANTVGFCANALDKNGNPEYHGHASSSAIF